LGPNYQIGHQLVAQDLPDVSCGFDLLRFPVSNHTENFVSCLKRAGVVNLGRQ
jgi:hypothetical protein